MPTENVIQNSNRRRHPRIPIKGNALLCYAGRVFKAHLWDVSSRGIGLKIHADDLSFKGDVPVSVETINGEKSVILTCKIRHINLENERHSQQRTYYIGLEHIDNENPAIDLCSLLFNTETATTDNCVLMQDYQSSHDARVIALLRESVKQSSLSRILGQNNTSAVIDEKINGEIKRYDGKWRSNIVLQSESIKIDFNVLYDVESVRTFIKMKNPHLSTEDRLCHDFVREFCNLTVGSVKIWIDKYASPFFMGTELRVLLPSVSPFELESKPRIINSDTPAVIHETWKIMIRKHAEIICFTDITILKWTPVSTLQVEKDEKSTLGGEDEIEFL